MNTVLRVVCLAALVVVGCGEASSSSALHDRAADVWPGGDAVVELDDAPQCEAVVVCYCARQSRELEPDPRTGERRFEDWYACVDSACRACGDASGPTGGTYRDDDSAGTPAEAEAVADSAACGASVDRARLDTCVRMASGLESFDEGVAADYVRSSQADAFGEYPTGDTLDRSRTYRPPLR